MDAEMDDEVELGVQGERTLGQAHHHHLHSLCYKEWLS